MNFDSRKYFARLFERDTRDFNPRSLRLSESGFDPRYRLAKMKGIYENVNFDLITLQMFHLGKLIESVILDEIKQDFPDLIRELPVVTPQGDMGHIDAYIPSLQLQLEIKTAGANIEHAPFPYNIWQPQAYLLYQKHNTECSFSEIRKVVLEEDLPDSIVNLITTLKPPKSSLIIYYNRHCEVEPRQFPILPNKETQSMIHLVTEKLHEAAEMQSIPPDSWWEENGINLKRFHTPQDFAMWRRRNADLPDCVFNYDPLYMAELRKAERIANEYYQLKYVIKDEKAASVLREELLPFFDNGVNDFVVEGGVIRGITQERTTFSAKKARDCGANIPATLEPFIKTTVGWMAKLIKNN